MQKKSELYSKPDTELYKDINSNIRTPQYKCIWKWGDNNETFTAIGTSKKSSEHCCAQLMLTSKFPNSWS